MIGETKNKSGYFLNKQDLTKKTETPEQKLEKSCEQISTSKHSKMSEKAFQLSKLLNTTIEQAGDA